MVAGLEPVTSGRILIGGNDVTLRAANERNVSMVFQSYALFPHMTVLENVCYGPLSMRVDKAKARELAHEKLAMLGLKGLEQRLPSELSGGQQQRVAVARSLVLEPAVLLFDEPLSNLDAKLRRRVRQEIRDLQQSLAADGDLRDARPGGGAGGLRPHHRDGRRPDRAAGHARSALRSSRRAASSPISSAMRTWSTASSATARTARVSRRGERERARARRRHGARRGDARRAAESAARHCAAAQGLLPGELKRAAYLGSRVEYVVATPWGELLVFDDARAPRARRAVARRRRVRPGRGDRDSASGGLGH